MSGKGRKKSWILIAVCLLFGCTFLTGIRAAAAESETVAVTEIDYDALTMTIDPRGNTIVYYSKDKSSWNELEYYTGVKEGTRVMDISWVSANSDTKLYLKGDKNDKVVTVSLPKRNTSLKVTFDKAEGILEFDNYEDADSFQWRKSTDYTWRTVSMNENSTAWGDFLGELEKLRVKGAKILVRTPGVKGTDAGNTGTRPSKEVTVSITKRSNAPSVTVNISKLTLNTTVKQEYSINNGSTWSECDKTMTLESMLPQVFVSHGATDGTLMIRTAATETAGYSKTQTIQIAAQRTAPSASLLSAYYESSSGGKTKKVVLQFTDATKTNAYEYVVVKPGTDFDETKAAWKSVTSSKVIKISQTSAPEGSVIYYRYKGTAANKTKGTGAVLPSAYGTFTVKYE